MNAKRLTCLVVMALLAVTTSLASALPVYTNDENPVFAVRSAQVRVEICNNLVQTNVSQRILNTSDKDIKCDIKLDLPKNAHISYFNADLDGKHYLGRVMENEKAIKEFDEAEEIDEVAGMAYETAEGMALKFTTVKSGSEFTFNFGYVEEAKYKDGLFSYTFGREYTAQNLPPHDSYTFNIEFRCTTAIKSVASPSHDMIGEINGGNAAFSVSKVAESNKAFELTWSLDLRPGEPVVMVKDKDGKMPAFSMLLLPPDTPVIPDPRAVVLILDKSGSMEGENFKMAIDAACEFIERLREVDIFNVLIFDTAQFYCAPFPYKADARGKSASIEFLREFKAVGGTRFLRPLVDSIETLKLAPNYLPSIVLLTDGEDNYDRAKAFHDAVSAACGFSMPIYTFAIGGYVDMPLLRTLAEYSGTTLGQIPTPASFRPAFELITTQFDSVVAENFNIAKTTDYRASFYPAHRARLYSDDLVVAYGNLPFDEKETITISARTANGAWKTSFDISTIGERSDCDFLDSAWAAVRMRDLLDRISIFGATDDIRKEVIALSIEYMISSPYTRFVFTYKDEVIEYWMQGGATGAYGQRKGGSMGKTRRVFSRPIPIVDTDLIFRDSKGVPVPNQSMAHAMLLAMRKDKDLEMLDYAYKSAQYFGMQSATNTLNKDLLELTLASFGLERLSLISGNRLIANRIQDELKKIDAVAVLEKASDEYFAITAYFTAELRRLRPDLVPDAIVAGIKRIMQGRANIDFASNPIGCDFDSALRWAQWFPFVLLHNDIYTVALPDEPLRTALTGLAFNPCQRAHYAKPDKFFKFMVNNMIVRKLTPETLFEKMRAVDELPISGKATFPANTWGKALGDRVNRILN